MDVKINSLWKENFSVYSENLSIYYVITIVISFLSVIFTWWYHKPSSQQPIIDEPGYPGCNTLEEINDKEEFNKTTEMMDLNDSNNDSDVLSQLKMSRQSAIVQQISAGLTEEQLKEEREAEAQQLAAIYQLLREQEDKFQVGSMEELQDQLKLYRS